MDDVIDYPSSADHAGELPPDLGEWRHERPIPKVRLPGARAAWLVTRYDSVRTVLDDARFTRDIGVGGAAETAAHEPPARAVNMDGRPHARLRSLVSKAFTVRRIERLLPRIEELAEGLLDSLERAGPPADLVRHLAAPLPAIAMCEMLGLPSAEHRTFALLCDRITAVGDAPDAAAWRELGGHVDRAARARRAALAAGSPADSDLLSTLVRLHDDAARLTWEELVTFTVVILAGGLETTQTAISAGLLRLLGDPAQMRRLRADPGLLGTAVEEILRYQPIVDVNRVQRATEDVRLGERLVRAGELVQISINSANRDGAVFPGGARFDIARRPNPHLAFGHGSHRCLGAALARLELRTALSVVLRRFPGLALAVPREDLRWRGGHVTVGLEELPVTW